jgi:hypothetical protein
MLGAAILAMLIMRRFSSAISPAKPAVSRLSVAEALAPLSASASS